MDPQKISELAQLLRNNGDKILSCEFTLTLSGTLLRALNDAFTLIADSVEVGEVHNFQVVKPMNSKPPVFSDLQLIHDFVQKTALLCLVEYPGDDYSGIIDISKFRALKRLELKKIDIQQVMGIKRLRNQLQHLICVKSIKTVDDIITKCGGDNSNGFVWNELQIADFSYNNLKCVNTSLEFAQYLQHLNLRHNKLQSVEAVKWLPNLKSLDVSYNRLNQVPQFHMNACRCLQSLNMGNNFVDSIKDIIKLDNLNDLDLSDNCLMDHRYLLPLRALINLKVLNLYGNPLHCHPKHRLETAKYLHENCSTVQFVLDFDTLSRSEKALIGSTQLRSMNTRYLFTFSQPHTTAIPSRPRTTTTSTLSSSIGSLISYTVPSDSDSVECNTSDAPAKVKQTKKSFKSRCVEIEDPQEDPQDKQDVAEDVMNTSLTSLEDSDDEIYSEHLETKRKILQLREKYGSEWLHTSNAEMTKNLSSSSTIDIDMERQKSREVFNEFIKDVRSKSINSNKTTVITTSTPRNTTLAIASNHMEVSPIGKSQQSQSICGSLPYQSFEKSRTLTDHAEKSSYKSLDDSKPFEKGNPFEDIKNSNPFEDKVNDKQNANPFEEKENEKEMEQVEQVECEQSEEITEDADDHLKNVYSSVENDDSECSDREDDEETYIVYNSDENSALFLTMSSKFLRERDTLTEKTKAKWSLKILESCERFKSNTLRINFDTVKADKKERVYRVEEDLCQELETKLRDVLSQRCLTEMNQNVYRCVNCSSNFSQEVKSKNTEIRCPNCKSTFVAEIHDIPESLKKILSPELSPAAIVEELSFPQNDLDAGAAALIDDSNSIGNGKVRLTANNPLQQATASLKKIQKRSATSLNDSSCSKITSNSESSFNSNQSLVGSSNTDRDLDFKGNGESDIDIISNPSQSSIEVLEKFSSRKTSEERRISQMPNLETIDDQSYTQTFLEREFENMINYANKDKPEELLDSHQQQSSVLQDEEKKIAKPMFTLNNLTESSSSGSVTDSVCTAYEHKDGLAMGKDSKFASKEFLQKETTHNGDNKTSETEEANGGLTSMFGAFMQSTNILMSSSKKLIDSEKFSNVLSGTVIQQQAAAAAAATTNTTSIDAFCSHQFKFNYVDFNDVDHRLKLYFYQTKFEQNTEHFKWIVRGRIYLEDSEQLIEGCVVVTNCKFYIMEAFAAESDDVAKWLRPINTCTVDRLEVIQLLPWKMGVSFYLRGWGGFLLLLQDIMRTDSLMLFLLNNALPPLCELKYQPNDVLTKRLNSAVINEQLNMCSILNGCEISCENAKRSISFCCLLTTDSHLYLSSQKLSWLSTGLTTDQQHEIANTDDDDDDAVQLCVTQFMSNLIDVEHCSDTDFILNFQDETQDKRELWKCTFETPQNASTCLNAIAQSWEKLFSVPLISA